MLLVPSMQMALKIVFGATNGTLIGPALELASALPNIMSRQLCGALAEVP
jgi:hypothetical protein